MFDKRRLLERFREIGGGRGCFFRISVDMIDLLFQLSFDRLFKEFDSTGSRTPKIPATASPAPTAENKISGDFVTNQNVQIIIFVR